MEKRILFAIFAVAALCSCYKLYEVKKQSKLTGILLTNIEALAEGETVSPKIKCYGETIRKEGSLVIHCSNCKILYDQAPAWYSRYDYCS